MTRCLVAAVAICLIGCDGQIPLIITKPKDDRVDVVKPDEPAGPLNFDAAIAADELAKQAEVSNDSIAENASEVIAGTLRMAESRRVLPSDFCRRVFDAVPALGQSPSRDLTPDEVAKLRSVR